MNLRLLSSACVLAITAVCGPAFAQTPSSGEAVTVEDLVVTAQRREENLQDVPIAVSAITGETLEKAKIESAYDVVKAAPALTVNRSVGYAIPFLRGIGSPNISLGDEPSVASYVDGFYQGPALSAVLPFNNIERVEVLKGPQGTLYGRNATGGLINIITKNPSESFFAKGTVGYGNYDTIQADAYVTGPIADNVRADLAVRYKDQGKGFVRNLWTGNRIGEEDLFAIRGKVVMDLTDDVSLTVTGEYSDLDNTIASAQPVLTGSKPIAALVGGLYSTNPRETYNTIDPIFNVKAYGATATLRADLGSVNFVSMSQYRRYTSSNQIDADATSADGVAFIDRPDHTPVRFNLPTFSFNSDTAMPYFWTQEFQLLSDTDGPLSWIAGLFGQSSREGYGSLDSRLSVTAPAVSHIFTKSDTKAVAAFAQGTYAFDSGLSLTAGGRYSWEKKSIVGRSENAANVVTARTDKEKTFKAFTYRLSADYRVNPELLVYASASKGFKSGVYIGGSINASPPVNPEKLYAYEVGFKSDPSNKLRINGTAYYYNYKDVQFYAKDPITELSTLQNAGSAELYGVEGELVARPIEGLTIRAAAAWEHAKYKDFIDAQVFREDDQGALANRGGRVVYFVKADGAQMVRTPKFTGNVSAVYDMPMANGAELSFGANAYYNGGYPFDPAGGVNQKKYAVVDGSVTWKAPGGNWSAAVWGKNLFNELFIESVTDGARNLRIGYSIPRTFGVTFTVQTR